MGQEPDGSTAPGASDPAAPTGTPDTTPAAEPAAPDAPGDPAPTEPEYVPPPAPVRPPMMSMSSGPIAPETGRFEPPVVAERDEETARGRDEAPRATAEPGDDETPHSAAESGHHEAPRAAAEPGHDNAPHATADPGHDNAPDVPAAPEASAPAPQESPEPDATTAPPSHRTDPAPTGTDPAEPTAPDASRASRPSSEPGTPQSPAAPPSPAAEAPRPERAESPAPPPKLAALLSRLREDEPVATEPSREPSAPDTPAAGKPPVAPARPAAPDAPTGAGSRPAEPTEPTGPTTPPGPITPPEPAAGDPVPPRARPTASVPTASGPPAPAPRSTASPEPQGAAAPSAPAVPTARRAPAVPLPPLFPAPFRPGHVSTPAERTAFRTLADAAWDRHGTAVSRTLTRLPALRGQEQEAARADLIALHLYLHAPEGPFGHEALARGLYEGEERLLPYAACVTSGLRRMPSYRGVAFRGAEGQDGGLMEPGVLLRDPAPVCVLPLAAGAPRPGGAQYAVWSVTGRRVRQLADRPGAGRDRDEVVFPPGTLLRVLDVREVGGAPLTLLREVPLNGPDVPARHGGAELDADDRTALARLDEALRGHPVAPGRHDWPRLCAGSLERAAGRPPFD